MKKKKTKQEWKNLFDGTTPEKVVEILDGIGKNKGARNQLSTITAIEDACWEGTSNVPGLAATIIVQQGHKIAQYGEKAFPLSIKQLQVIERYLRDAVNLANC